MGAPKAPTIVQQMTAPSADEKQAKIDAERQKAAALAKINQDVFARSQGLRGAASMYDMAGPTPWLAGAHVARPPVAKKPTPTTARKTTYNPLFDHTIGGHGGGKGESHEPFGLPSRGGKGEEKGPFGAAPSPYYGGKSEEHKARPDSTLPGPKGKPVDVEAIMLANVNQQRANIGLAPVAAKPYTPPPTLADPLVLLKAKVAAQQKALGLKPTPQAPAAPVGHPIDVHAVMQQNIAQQQAAKGIKPMTAQAPASTPAPKAQAPASTPAPKAPATTAAAPPQQLAAPAPIVATKPTTAPAPSPTLGGVAKPVVYANPNLKTIAPMPKAGIMRNTSAFDPRGH